VKKGEREKGRKRGKTDDRERREGRGPEVGGLKSEVSIRRVRFWIRRHHGGRSCAVQ
jgi:hypothetical protein